MRQRQWCDKRLAVTSIDDTNAPVDKRNQEFRMLCSVYSFGVFARRVPVTVISQQKCIVAKEMPIGCWFRSHGVITSCATGESGSSPVGKPKCNSPSGFLQPKGRVFSNCTAGWLLYLRLYALILMLEKEWILYGVLVNMRCHLLGDYNLARG